MGKAKALLDFGGEPLIIRIVRTIEPLVSSVTVVGPSKLYGDLGLQVIEDQRFGIPDEASRSPGPLLGIATALRASRTNWNLILACDLPYLSREWVNWLLARTKISSAQVIMPRTEGGPEPLAAVYRRSCAEASIEALRRGVRKVTDAMEQLRTEFVTEREWRQIDPDERMLRNMNAPEDYEEARKWLEARRL